MEICWFLRGLRFGTYFLGFLRYHSIGTKMNVVFDWRKAMSRFVIGWLHSHVDEKVDLDPSEEDNRAMRSFVRAKWLPLICGICNEEGHRWYEYRRMESGEIVHKEVRAMMIKKLIVFGRTGG